MEAEVSTNEELEFWKKECQKYCSNFSAYIDL